MCALIIVHVIMLQHNDILSIGIFQECNFWLTNFSCFRLSISAISYTISIHKMSALATKCIFQNYSQLLDNFTWLVLKTAEKLFVPSVYNHTGMKSDNRVAYLRCERSPVQIPGELPFFTFPSRGDSLEMRRGRRLGL